MSAPLPLLAIVLVALLFHGACQLPSLRRHRDSVVLARLGVLLTSAALVLTLVMLLTGDDLT